METISYVKELLDQLCDGGSPSFSKLHYEVVLSKDTRGLQVSQLLNILECRSFLHYRRFLNALQETDQPHVHSVLTDGAGRHDY